MRNLEKVYCTYLEPNAKHDHGPIRVFKGPQGTTHSMVPLWSQIQDPECGPRIGTKIWSLIMGPFFRPSNQLSIIILSMKG